MVLIKLSNRSINHWRICKKGFQSHKLSNPRGIRVRIYKYSKNSFFQDQKKNKEGKDDGNFFWRGFERCALLSLKVVLFLADTKLFIYYSFEVYTAPSAVSGALSIYSDTQKV